MVASLLRHPVTLPEDDNRPRNSGAISNYSIIQNLDALLNTEEFWVESVKVRRVLETPVASTEFSGALPGELELKG